MNFKQLLIITLLQQSRSHIVINTWPFTHAATEAHRVLNSGGSALDAVESGCRICQVEQCDGTVGYGGSPDENGETTLDAMIMDGDDANVGAVGGIRRIKDAVGVARKVLEHTKHSILVGDLATEFAVKMGFKEESLNTEQSKRMWKEWKKRNCQPNFWMGVTPDPRKQCGPYKPVQHKDSSENEIHNDLTDVTYNHDTIGMVVLDKYRKVVAGTSTNGLKFKIPGRIGDSPIPGSGAFADSQIGGAAATGDGDVMLRFLPSFVAVDQMLSGKEPQEAAEVAILRIIHKVKAFSGAVIALRIDGKFGAACHGMKKFHYSVASDSFNQTEIYSVDCINALKYN